MSDTFAAPSPQGDSIELKEHLGALLLIDVLSYERGVMTVHGDADVVRCNIAVIDGNGAGKTYSDTLLFGKVLVSQTKNQIGARVLGRLTQGQAKPGQSAPWSLAEAQPADIAAAQAYVRSQPAAMSSPSSAQPPF